LAEVSDPSRPHIQSSSAVESSGESSAPSVWAMVERRPEAPVPFVLLLFWIAAFSPTGGASSQSFLHTGQRSLLFCALKAMRLQC
jgi:hypothetical protein